MAQRFVDRTLRCVDCSCDFVWPAGEQEFWAVMGFDKNPQRCPACRAAWRRQKMTAVRHTLSCAGCGELLAAPIERPEGEPLYCRECAERRSAQHIAGVKTRARGAAG